MQETEGTYLIAIPCKAATFHGARVEVTLIVKLEHRQAGVDVIEHRGQATPQGQELGAVAVESHAHGTLEGEIATIAQERTGRQEAEGLGMRWMDKSLQNNHIYFFPKCIQNLLLGLHNWKYFYTVG